MMLFYRILRIVLGLLFLQSAFLYAGSKNVSKATSPVVSVDVSGFYIGAGIGWMRLKDDYTFEFFETFPLMLQAGYRLNEYVSLEARYVRDNGKVRYENGNTPNPDYDDYPTLFSNKGLYLKVSYPWERLSLYALLGYGEVSLTHIKGAKRAERGFQWGAGISYKLSDHFDLFTDYTRLYGGKGFSGRARKKETHADLIMMGVTYVF